ncbi:unnamed protein product [Peniophora sp. CBMAI 1063]|nr:unnamed protein product [Peniophora sp. CBMAI 1063]
MRARALGAAVDLSTALSYSSGTRSYLSFTKLHELPVDPTADTLSLFAVYMSSYIKPTSVDSYLSGVCNVLEPFYPDVRKNRNSALVRRTIKGCKRLYSSAPERAEALTLEDLARASHTLVSPSHDDLAFLAMLHVGFFGLHRLAELTDHDTPKLRNPRKTMRRSTVKFADDGTSFSYWLPTHKADALYEGNTVHILRRDDGPDPMSVFRAYLASRDRRPFALCPQLWLLADGRVPTRSWFTSRLRQLFPNSGVGGHSMRPGGATFFALEGYPDDRIQGLGRWTSDAFKMYIRKHPALLHALLLARSRRDGANAGTAA